MGMVKDREAWELRAALCELLAAAFRYPGEPLSLAVAKGEWDAAVDEAVERCGIPACDEAAAADFDSDDAAEAAFRGLRHEATRLFVGSPDPKVSPYEGVWRAVDEGVSPLLFVNPHSMEVERFMRSCGLGRPAGTNEPLDHVVAELELLGCLAAWSAGFETDRCSVALSDLPGGSPQEAFRLFFEQHALAWMPRFADEVEKETRLAFYRQAAFLLKGFLESR